MEIDPEKEEKVWQRVHGEVKTCPSLTAEKVQALAAEERDTAALYGTLAKRLKGEPARMLEKMCRQELCHSKKLAAMYFLLTGQRLCPEPGKRPCITCLNETLRQQYAKELEDSRNYDALASGAGDLAPTLQTMAAEEGGHSRMLLCILQEIL